MEVLSRCEVTDEESFTHHAVEGRRPARATADERHVPPRDAPADVFDLVGAAAGPCQGFVVSLRGPGGLRFGQFGHFTANRSRHTGQRGPAFFNEQHPPAGAGEPVSQHPATHAGAYDDDVPDDAFGLARVRLTVSHSRRIHH